MKSRSRMFLVFIFLAVSILVLDLPTAAEESVQIHFKVKVKCDTPKGEVVCVLINPASASYLDYGIQELKKIGTDTWEGSVNFHKEWLRQTIQYRYCRNYMDPWSDESFNKSNKKGWRYLELTKTVLEVNDVVKKWRWWPVDGVVPDIDTSLHQKTPPAFMPRPDFMRGIAMVDFWWDNFSPTIVPAMDKMIMDTRANWLLCTPLPEITRFYPTPIIKREGNNGTPEKELIKIIKEAHKRGLKVWLRPGMNALLVHDPSPNYHSNTWWKAFAEQWDPILLYYADLAQKYGVEMLGFQAWPYIGDISFEEYPIVDELSDKLLKKVRRIYQGKITTEFMWFTYDLGVKLKVFNETDYINFSLSHSSPWILGKSRKPSVQEMMAILRKGMDELFYPYFLRLKKKIVLEHFAAASFDGAAMGAHADEPGISASEDENPQIKIDLQEQADILDAMLYALSERDWIVGAFNFGSFYHDSIDKDIQVRGKPAEKVVAKWYKWLNPKNLTLTIVASTGGTTVPEPASYVKIKGNSAKITAKPAAGYAFTGWIGNVPSAQKKTNPLTVLMNKDKKLTARFKRIKTGSPQTRASGYENQKSILRIPHSLKRFF